MTASPFHEGEQAGQARVGVRVGLLAIDLMARRRLRVDGRGIRWAPDAVEVAVTGVVDSEWAPEPPVGEWADRPGRPG